MSLINSSSSSGGLARNQFLDPQARRNYPIDSRSLGSEVKENNFSRTLKLIDLLMKDSFKSFINQQEELCAELIPIFNTVFQKKKITLPSYQRIADIFREKGIFSHSSLICDVTLYEDKSSIVKTNSAVLFMFSSGELKQPFSSEKLLCPNKEVAKIVHAFIHDKDNNILTTNAINISWENLLQLIDYTKKLAFLQPIYKKSDELLDHWSNNLKKPEEILKLDKVLSKYSSRERKLVLMHQGVIQCLRLISANYRWVADETGTKYRHICIGLKNFYLLERDDRLGQIFREYIRGIVLPKQGDIEREMLTFWKPKSNIDKAFMYSDHVGEDMKLLQKVFPNLITLFIGKYSSGGRLNFKDLLDCAKKVTSCKKLVFIDQLTPMIGPLNLDRYDISDWMRSRFCTQQRGLEKHLDSTILELIKRKVHIELYGSDSGLHLKKYLSTEYSNFLFTSYKEDSDKKRKMHSLFEQLMPRNMTITEKSGIYNFRRTPGKHADTVEIVIDDCAGSSSKK
jgi:hypothetical protein